MSPSPRILMILENESFPEDTRVLLEARALVEAEFDVTVICPTGKRKAWNERIDGVRVYRYPEPWAIDGFIGYLAEFAYSMVMAFLYCVFVLFRHGFDAIHVHTPPDMNILVALCFRPFGKKIVIDHHDLSPELYQAQRDGEGSSLVTRVLLWFERTACRNADRLIATNHSQQKVQTERGGAASERCYIVRNGPNDMFLTDVLPRQDLANDERIKVGYVGMIGIQDGVDCFVESLVELKKRRSDFLGIIVGAGPALKSLKQQVLTNGLGQNVVFTGLVDFSEVPGYIAAFDICVTPDPKNAYNDSCTTIKTMEYMALRKPTVSFCTTENRITAGEAALYAEDNDILEFTSLLEQLMDCPDMRRTMGDIGRQRIDDALSWERQQTHLVDLYDDLFTRGKSSANRSLYSSAETVTTSVNQEPANANPVNTALRGRSN